MHRRSGRKFPMENKNLKQEPGNDAAEVKSLCCFLSSIFVLELKREKKA